MLMHFAANWWGVHSPTVLLEFAFQKSAFPSSQEHFYFRPTKCLQTSQSPLDSGSNVSIVHWSERAAVHEGRSTFCGRTLPILRRCECLQLQGYEWLKSSNTLTVLSSLFLLSPVSGRSSVSSRTTSSASQVFICLLPLCPPLRSSFLWLVQLCTSKLHSHKSDGRGGGRLRRGCCSGLRFCQRLAVDAPSASSSSSGAHITSSSSSSSFSLLKRLTATPNCLELCKQPHCNRVKQTSWRDEPRK